MPPKFRPIPDRPSIDRTDPKVLARAKGVVTRRNNEVRRKLPLFADQIPQVTVEDVFDQRERAQIHADEFFAQQQEREKHSINEQRMFIRAHVTAEEFAAIESRQYNQFAPRWAFWSIMKSRIEKRNDPMTDEADIILAILQTWEGPPPTPYELHQKCGDGMTIEQVKENIYWLMEREYLKPCVGRRCEVSGIPFVGTYAVQEVKSYEILSD